MQPHSSCSTWGQGTKRCCEELGGFCRLRVPSCQRLQVHTHLLRSTKENKGSVLPQLTREAGNDSHGLCWPVLSLHGYLLPAVQGLPHEVGVGHVIIPIVFSCGMPTHLLPSGLPPQLSDLELGTCLALANGEWTGMRSTCVSRLYDTTFLHTLFLFSQAPDQMETMLPAWSKCDNDVQGRVALT